jgi:hypothetical protein
VTRVQDAVTSDARVISDTIPPNLYLHPSLLFYVQLSVFGEQTIEIMKDSESLPVRVTALATEDKDSSGCSSELPSHALSTHLKTKHLT